MVFDSPLVFCVIAWSQAGQKWRRKVLSRWLLADCVLILHLPPAPRDHSPEPSEASLKVDGTVTSTGQSPRCWEVTNKLFALPSQCPYVTSCGCVPLPCKHRLSHLSLLFPPLFMCVLYADTELESLFIFSLFLLQNIISHSGKICFLPQRYHSSAPVGSCCSWSRSNQLALG